jgi:hypothetical protein
MANRNKPRAGEDSLGELHKTLADMLLLAIKSGEAPASVLNVARQFLKDNSIECIVEENASMTDILKSLPTFEEQRDEETGKPFAHRLTEPEEGDLIKRITH